MAERPKTKTNSGGLRLVWAQALKPDPTYTLSEWAEREFYLSGESSAEPGAWRAWPFQRGIMDAFTDPSVETVVLMKSARVGYSKTLCAAIAYHIAEVPAPQLLVQPTVEDAQGFSKDEIAPMLRDVPKLRGLVADPRARDSGNTVTKKNFPGGALSIVGANSPRGFRRLTCRCVWFDEVDGYPPAAGTEGDQIKLGMMRSQTYWNRKIALGSTPTIKGVSRIEAWYERSDQRRYFVPCPECGARHVLRWADIKWPEGEPEAAAWCCPDCGSLVPHSKKRWMVERGEWVATAEGKPMPRVRGFHISALYSYSPNADWGRLAGEFLDAKRAVKQGNVEPLKTFVNTVLGETWEEQGEGVDYGELVGRREDYGGPEAEDAPDGVLVVTAGIDVQGDRLECELVGWGAGEESWSLDYVVVRGDPGRPEVWADLDRHLERRWRSGSMGDLGVAAVGIDTGHQTASVYDWVRPRQPRRVFALKGANVAGKPLVSRPTRVGSGRVSLFTVGTEAAKDLVYARLRVEEAGPGFCHFPSCYDAEYFAQLTAERAVTTWRGGVQVRVYKQTRPRNEALDCRVYALAALRILNVNWKALARRAGVVEAAPAVEAEESSAEYGDREADELAEVARANRPVPASPQPRTVGRRPRGGGGGFVSRY